MSHITHLVKMRVLSFQNSAVQGLWTIFVLTQCVHGFPSSYRQGRQDDDDDTPNYNAGLNVAQIILGALTGNIDSIVKGSFGFIDDPTVNKLSHNTWETLKGNPTQTPPWLTTTPSETASPSNKESNPDSVQEPIVQSAPMKPTAVQVPLVQKQKQQQVAEVTLSPVGHNSPAPEIYNQVPTSSPPAGAPLSVVIEISKTTPTTDIDDEDTDEAEGEGNRSLEELPIEI